MKKLIRRGCALLLLLTILAGICLQAAAATGSKIYNSGTRGTVCMALTSQAKAYYTGSNTYEALSKLSGASSATDSYAATQNNPLYDALADLMSDTQTDSITYSSLSTYFYYTDTQNGKSNVMTLFWAGAERNWNGNYVNREHVWPKSHASFYQLNGGADIHHLRPASAVVNQDHHNNLPYGTATGGKESRDEQNNFAGYYNGTYFEPRDDIKGDTARILLYVYVRWGQPNLYSDVASNHLPKMDSDDNKNDGKKVIESLDTLLRWCEEDPVDTWEMGRNDAAEKIQGNRNVFIDYPELAYLMFGKDIPNMETPSGIAAQQGGTHTHSWSPWTVKEPATCTEDGTETRSCTSCGETEERVLKAEGHKLQKTEAKDPTCTESGNIAYWQCSVCFKYFKDANGDTETTLDQTVLKPDGHKLQKTEAKDPTCTEAGNIAYWQCSVCFKYYKDANGDTETTLDQTVLKPNGHQMQKTEAKDPTCTEAGNHEYWQCSVCLKYFQDPNGETETTLDRTVMAPTGHQMQKIEAKEPTDTEPGNITYWYCGACLKYFKDANGETEISQSQTVIPPLSHSHSLTEYKAQPATCAEPGNIAYWYCAGCGKYFSDGDAQTEISYEKTILAATGHKWDAGVVTTEPTCTQKGLRTYTCENCAEKRTEDIPATGAHVWDGGAVTTPPTATEPGVRTYTCTLCGLTRTEVIPATGDEKCDGGDGCPSHAMTDIPDPSNWAHAGIDYVLENKLMNGMENNQFQPDTAMTRGMLVTVLWRYAGSPQEGKNIFSDVDSGRYYTDAVAWAAANGIVNGVGDGKFDPEGNVTREQMATILYRYGGTSDVGKANVLTAYPDAEQVSNFAKEAMRWAVAEGVINGADGKLLPQNNATRAEVATILMRFIEYVQ